MEIRYRKFKDLPDMNVDTVKRGNVTEMIEYENKVQRNLDIPDNLAYYDMGIETRRNEHLDVRECGKSSILRQHRLGFKYQSPCNAGCMDDRHFREHCTVYGDRLYFVHQKVPADMQPALQLRPEWIQQKMECRFEDACTLSAAWKKLGYDKWVVNRIMFGYVAESGEKKNGLQYAGPAKGFEYAKYFEDLAFSLEEFKTIEEELRGHFLDVSQRMIESGEWRAQYYEDQPHPISQMQWIEEQTIEEMGIMTEDFIDQEIDGYVSHLGEEEPVQRTAEAFGINPLFDGNDSIDHELILEIKEANTLKLRKIQQRFFKQRTMYGWQQPIYWWFTDSQRERAWKFINARKEELADPSHMSDYSKKIIENILEEAVSGRLKKAMIACYCAGSSFNLYGETIKWEKKPAENEVYAIWAAYREKEAA